MRTEIFGRSMRNKIFLLFCFLLSGCSPLNSIECWYNYDIDKINSDILKSEKLILGNEPASRKLAVYNTKILDQAISEMEGRYEVIDYDDSDITSAFGGYDPKNGSDGRPTVQLGAESKEKFRYMRHLCGLTVFNDFK
jgi:hypothetical protein